MQLAPEVVSSAVQSSSVAAPIGGIISSATQSALSVADGISSTVSAAASPVMSQVGSIAPAVPTSSADPSGTSGAQSPAVPTEPVSFTPASTNKDPSLRAVSNDAAGNANGATPPQVSDGTASSAPVAAGGSGVAGAINPSDSTLSTGTIVGIAVGSAALLIFVALLIWWRRKKAKKDVFADGIRPRNGESPSELERGATTVYSQMPGLETTYSSPRETTVEAEASRSEESSRNIGHNRAQKDQSVLSSAPTALMSSNPGTWRPNMLSGTSFGTNDTDPWNTNAGALLKSNTTSVATSRQYTADSSRQSFAFASSDGASSFRHSIMSDAQPAAGLDYVGPIAPARTTRTTAVTDGYSVYWPEEIKQV